MAKPREESNSSLAELVTMISLVLMILMLVGQVSLLKLRVADLERDVKAIRAKEVSR